MVRGTRHLHIVMEYLGEGDPTKHINLPRLQDTIQNISKQILEGLRATHQQSTAGCQTNAKAFWSRPSTVKTRIEEKCARTLEFPFSATRGENTANSAPS